MPLNYFQEVPFLLGNGIYISLRLKIYLERGSPRSAALYGRRLLGNLLTEDAMMHCTMDGSSIGSKRKDGALPGINHLIKEAVFRKLKFKKQIN